MKAVTEIPLRILRSENLAAFVAWLGQPNGKLALAVTVAGDRPSNFNVRHLAFGASDGSGWCAAGSDRSLCQRAIQLAAGGTRRLWAHDATRVSLAVMHGLGVKLRRLNCSRMLVRVAAPAVIGTPNDALHVLRPVLRRAAVDLAAQLAKVAGIRVVAEGENTWLADAIRALPATDPVLMSFVFSEAVECAKLVNEWDERLRPEVRDVVLVETEIDDVWRWVAERGYVVDTDMLVRELRQIDQAQAKSVVEQGIDLTANSGAVQAWVVRQGIRIHDPKGRSTLSRHHWSSAFVPEASQDAWETFKAIRTVGANASKLREIQVAICQSPDGRLRPLIQGIGASTGRTSIGKPALQNLPGALRGLLLADAGMTLVGCDLDRVEPRVIAALSGDDALREACESDIYEELAVRVYGEVARGDANLRNVAKRAFLAPIYGQGSDALALALAIPNDEAVGLLRTFRRTFPAVDGWQRDVSRAALGPSPMVTAWGRPLPTPRDAYLAVNWIVQGTAADLFKRITLDVTDRLGPDALWIPVHDELVVQVREGDEELAVAALQEAMTTELLGVPIMGTPCVMGRRWKKI